MEAQPGVTQGEARRGTQDAPQGPIRCLRDQDETCPLGRRIELGRVDDNGAPPLIEDLCQPPRMPHGPDDEVMPMILADGVGQYGAGRCLIPFRQLHADQPQAVTTRGIAQFLHGVSRLGRRRECRGEVLEATFTSLQPEQGIQGDVAALTIGVM